MVALGHNLSCKIRASAWGDGTGFFISEHKKARIIRLGPLAQ
ncbi:MAG: hypothetical protein ACE5IW_12125 [bacterium]